MSRTTITSREFNRDAGGAKRATANGPVFITDRGRPAHVLLSIEDYRRLASDDMSIAYLLHSPEAAAVEFAAPRMGDKARAAELS